MEAYPDICQKCGSDRVDSEKSTVIDSTVGKIFEAVKKILN